MASDSQLQIAAFVHWLLNAIVPSGSVAWGPRGQNLIKSLLVVFSPSFPLFACPGDSISHHAYCFRKNKKKFNILNTFATD
jgi:hypothetical protein